MKVDLEVALAHALRIGRLAAEGIAATYATAFVVEYKAKNDPVTKADRDANTLICAELGRLYPGMPIVAEESDPSTYEGYVDAEAAWFVDPLDGTREFVARNGEFAVMIGLAEEGRARLGVLVAPALGRTFVGAEGLGAFEVHDDGTRTPVHVSSVATLDEAEIVVSRSQRSPEAQAALERFGARKITRCGGAGIKAARIATGEADLYAQPGRAGKLWDACAPEAIVKAAGGAFTDARGQDIDYRSPALDNRHGLLAANLALHRAIVVKLAPLFASGGTDAGESGRPAPPAPGDDGRETR